MRALKGLVSIAVSIGLILAVTAILWRLTLTTESSRALVYIYLFPVALIAALYNGRLALLSAALALVCVPTISCRSRCTVSPMTILVNTATFLFSPFWLSRRSSLSEYWYDPAHC
jgi:hypothetical protein